MSEARRVWVLNVFILFDNRLLFFLSFFSFFLSPCRDALSSEARRVWVLDFFLFSSVRVLFPFFFHPFSSLFLVGWSGRIGRRVQLLGDVKEEGIGVEVKLVTALAH